MGAKPGDGQKKKVYYGEQCVLFYMRAAFFVLFHHLLFVHLISGFVLRAVAYPRNHEP